MMLTFMICHHWHQGSRISQSVRIRQKLYLIKLVPIVLKWQDIRIIKSPITRNGTSEYIHKQSALHFGYILVKLPEN